MLKARVIPTLLLKDHGLVKGVGFDSWRRVGTLPPAVRVYNTRDVDELVVLDIAATPAGRTPSFEEVEDVAPGCRVPLTVGGGIRTIDDVAGALQAGADKISVNSEPFTDMSVVSETAARFGSQCVVASIDARWDAGAGRHECFSHSGQQRENIDAPEWAKRLEAAGAGEILVCSIDRDGTMEGYDLRLISSVVDCVGIPVIAAGGCGTYEHMLQAIRDAGAQAVSAASMFHFTEQTPLEAKKFLGANGIPVRAPSRL